MPVTNAVLEERINSLKEDVDAIHDSVATIRDNHLAHIAEDIASMKTTLNHFENHMSKTDASIEAMRRTQTKALIYLSVIVTTITGGMQVMM
jgi:septation ring formation regulator EzrA